MKVQKHERRSIDELLNKNNCNHNRLYQGQNGWWYCADCPEFAFEEVYFDGRTTAGAKWPKGAHLPASHKQK